MNWLFAASLRDGELAAAIMDLIPSARKNGHDSYAYLKDVSRGYRRSARMKLGNGYHISGYLLTLEIRTKWSLIDAPFGRM